jgi:predicted nuclease of predicted toxin-antitoxin system
MSRKHFGTRQLRATQLSFSHFHLMPSDGAVSVVDRPKFFVDRCLGKKVGIRLREIGVTVVFHDDQFPQTAKDSEWIPVVTASGWVILTKDKNIRRVGGEREDVLKAGARIFTLTSGNMSGQQMADMFIRNIDEIERIANASTPPFVYIVRENGCEPIQITPIVTPPQTPPETAE